MALICTNTDFTTSAQKYSSEILTMMVKRIEALLPYFTVKTGIRHKENSIELDADFEYGPYNPARTAQLDVNVGIRPLQTYLCSARREFDPNAFAKTILGSDIIKGTGLTGVEIARRVLDVVSGKLGDHIARHIFDAVLNPSGTTTEDCFNGLDTITAAEITGGGLAVNKGNLFEFSAALDETNTVDGIKEFCLAASEELTGKEKVNLLVSRRMYFNYCEDYKATTGATPYNHEYKQVFVEGFENVALCPMYQKASSQYIQLSTKDNLLIGTGRKENIQGVIVEKHDVVNLTFFAAMFLGVDYRSLLPDRVMVGKLYTSSNKG